MGNRITWTESRKAVLRDLLAQGLTYKQAAEQMGIRRDQARTAAHAHDLGPSRAPRKYRDWARHEYDHLEALLDEGLTYPQIAKRMGLEINQVKGAAQRLGMMHQARIGQHRRRRDWPQIDRISRDCIEVQLMTIPQTHQHLAALGHHLGLGTLYRHIKALDPVLRARAEQNSKRRMEMVGRRVQMGRKARRRQQEVAA